MSYSTRECDRVWSARFGRARRDRRLEAHSWDMRTEFPQSPRGNKHKSQKCRSFRATKDGRMRGHQQADRAGYSGFVRVLRGLALVHASDYQAVSTSDSTLVQNNGRVNIDESCLDLSSPQVTLCPLVSSKVQDRASRAFLLRHTDGSVVAVTPARSSRGPLYVSMVHAG